MGTQAGQEALPRKMGRNGRKWWGIRRSVLCTTNAVACAALYVVFMGKLLEVVCARRGACPRARAASPCQGCSEQCNKCNCR